MAVGRISGPLLKDNLLRNGVNLAFETSLLYLDVVNSRVGINTATPQYDLDVNGFFRTTNFNATTNANLATFTFNGNTISSSSNTINFLPTGVNPTVFSGVISVGNLNLTANTLSSTNTNGAINFTANGSGAINLGNTNGNVQVTVNGSLHATGDITADGNIQLGNQTTDTITFTGEVNSNIIPSADATYNLGSALLKWNNLYVGTVVTPTLNAGNVQISGNTITTTNTNGNLNLTANGTGSVQVQNLNIYNNIISSVNTNANIVLTPQGTGSVLVSSTQSLIVPVGTTVQRPTGANGMVRYNTSTNRYEGYANGYWTNIGGVQSVDGNTYITPESSPGAGNNVINFVAGGVNTAYIDSSKLYSTDVKTANIDISGSTVSTYTTDTDLNLTPNGTGSVVLGPISFNSNGITNTTTNAVTSFTSTGNGYYIFGGTYGVAIPVGNGTSDRPPTLYSQIGMVRFNTDQQAVEVYNGSAWGSIVGNAGGINASQAGDISIATVLALG